jgi:hypothetical protein
MRTTAASIWKATLHWSAGALAACELTSAKKWIKNLRVGAAQPLAMAVTSGCKPPRIFLKYFEGLREIVCS